MLELLPRDRHQRHAKHNACLQDESGNRGEAGIGKHRKDVVKRKKGIGNTPTAEKEPAISPSLGITAMNMVVAERWMVRARAPARG